MDSNAPAGYTVCNNSIRHDCECEPHTPQILRCYSSLSAGLSGEGISNRSDYDFFSQLAGSRRRSKSADAVGNINVTRKAAGVEDIQTTEAISLTEPPVVDGSTNMRETPMARGHHNYLVWRIGAEQRLDCFPADAAPNHFVAPVMQSTSWVSGFANGHYQNYANNQQPVMGYQHPYYYQAPPQPLSDAAMNLQLVQELTIRERHLHEVQLDNHNLRGQIDHLSNGVAAETARNEELTNLVRQVTAEKAALECTTREMRRQIEELTAENNRLNSSLQQSGRLVEMEILKTDLRQKENYIERQERIHGQRKQEIRNLTAANTEQQKKIYTLKRHIEAAVGFYNSVIMGSHRAKVASCLECTKRSDMLNALHRQIRAWAYECSRDFENMRRYYEDYSNGIARCCIKQQDEIDELMETNKDVTTAICITMQGAKEENDKHRAREERSKADISNVLANLQNTSEALIAATSKIRAKEQEVDELTPKLNKKPKENESRTKRQARLNAMELNQKLSKELEAEKDRARAAELEKLEWQQKFQELAAKEVMAGKGTYLLNMEIFFILVVVFFTACKYLAVVGMALTGSLSV